MNRDVRDDVLKLIERKEQLESEISQLNAILRENNVGMDDPLVDEEGFPLATVDVYQVRHTRHLLKNKFNDHRNVMKQIEEGIAEYYGSSEPDQVVPLGSVKQYTEPFARITMVHIGSPAHTAGIMDGDLLVEFGSVNSENFRSLADIGDIVQHSHGHKINLKLKRGEQLTRVAIKPKKWEGRGLLGCNVVLMES